jgi:hypothetical protein
MRVALYARVSTARQAQAQGIEQQLDRLRAAAAERGWELDDQHVYRDDGYSGARIGRPGLDRLRDQRQTRQAALPRPADQQLTGLIPAALAVAARDGLTAHAPGPVHRALLPGRHHLAEQIPATAADGATSSSSAAPAAHSRTCHL